MSNNSTIVRSFPGSSSSLLRRTITTLCERAPGVMARLAGGLFLRPMGRSRRRGRAELEKAEHFLFHSRGKALSAWMWGQGPLVLLAHGWAGRGGQMAPLGQALAQAGFRAIVFDAPGHGRSPGATSSLPEMAWAIHDLGRRMGPVHGLVAHSLGSAAASHALYQGLQVEKVVYMAPVADITYLAHLYMEKIGFTREVLKRMQAWTERRFGTLWAQFEGRKLAPSLGHPLLLFHDRADRQVPWEQGRALAAAWPEAELVSTRGRGHLGILRDPAVIERTVEFLGQPSRS